MALVQPSYPWPFALLSEAAAYGRTAGSRDMDRSRSPVGQVVVEQPAAVHHRPARADPVSGLQTHWRNTGAGVSTDMFSTQPPAHSHSQWQTANGTVTQPPVHNHKHTATSTQPLAQSHSQQYTTTSTQLQAHSQQHSHTATSRQNCPQSKQAQPPRASYISSQLSILSISRLLHTAA